MALNTQGEAPISLQTVLSKMAPLVHLSHAMSVDRLERVSVCATFKIDGSDEPLVCSMKMGVCDDITGFLDYCARRISDATTTDFDKWFGRKRKVSYGS